MRFHWLICRNYIIYNKSNLKAIQALWSVLSWGLGSVHFSHGRLEFVLIFGPYLSDSVFAVEALSYHFVSSDELVDLAGQLIVLVGDHSDVIVHGVDFNLKVGVVLKKSLVWISGPFKLFSHVHQLVLLLPDPNFKLLDLSRDLNVWVALRVNAPLQVLVLLLIPLFKSLKVV